MEKHERLNDNIWHSSDFFFHSFSKSERIETVKFIVIPEMFVAEFIKINRNWTGKGCLESLKEWSIDQILRQNRIALKKTDKAQMFLEI